MGTSGTGKCIFLYDEHTPQIYRHVGGDALPGLAPRVGLAHVDTSPENRTIKRPSSILAPAVFKRMMARGKGT